jgi:hypothetical protein
MDDPNKEFEGYLRQFRLRELGPLPEGISGVNRWMGRWAFAAAAVLVAVVVGFGAAGYRIWYRPAAVPEGHEPAITATPAIAATQQEALPQPEPAHAAKELEPQPVPTRIRPNRVVPPPQVPAVIQQESPRQNPQEPPPPRDQRPKKLPDGPGKEILDRACSTCHSVSDAVRTMPSYSTRDEYAAYVGRKNSIGAGLTPAEVSVLVDYLYDNFGKK